LKGYQTTENDTDVGFLSCDEEAQILQSIVGDSSPEVVANVLGWAKTVMLSYCCLRLLLKGKATIEHQGDMLEVTSDKYRLAECAIDGAGEYADD
jgi:hypothetical protein